MLPCEGCAYKRDIPGSAHIACAYRWDRVPYLSRQWFIFPFNYDPLWGPDECAARAEVADPAKVVADSPILSITRIFASRL
jgi:hypothetical protein